MKQKVAIINVDFEKDTVGAVAIEDIFTFESTPEAIFGHVSRISFAAEKIFILDNRRREALYVFDQEGKFLNKTAYGKGPGEVLDPLDYYIDPDNNSILLFDFSLQRFLTYDLNLNHLSSLSLSKHTVVRWFDRFQEDKWLVHFQNRLEPTDPRIYSYLIYSSHFEEVLDTLLPDPIIENEKLTMFNPISRETSEQFLCRPFDQTLYAFENDEVKVKYYLDFGQYSIRQADKEKGLEHVLRLKRNGERVSILGDLMNSDRYIAVSIAFKQQADYVIYSKHTGRTRCSIPSTSLPYGVLKGMINDSTFILMVEPHTFLDYATENGLDPRKYEDVREGGNDVMMLFSLRE
jgi:hypothetical protein